MPRAIVRAVLRMRAHLLKMADALIPPQAVILDELAGVSRTAALHVVAKHRIADRLATGRKDKTELAAETGLPAELVERLLSALITVGIFDVDRSGRYSNNRNSLPLRSDSDGSLRAMTEWFGDKTNMLVWSELENAALAGTSPFAHVFGCSVWDYFAKETDKGRLFDTAMGELTKMDAPFIASNYDFSKFERLCDVGGGRGTLLATILARNPRLRGLLFDAAHVLEEAGPVLSDFGVADRVDRSAGSFFDRIPRDCDGYLLKDILHDWNDEKCVQILQNIRDAMSPRARLLVCELPIDHKKPEYPAPISDMQVLIVCDGGKQRSTADFSELFRAAHLRLDSVHPMPTPMTVYEAVPA